LLAAGGPPRPTSASCRSATARETAATPFGATSRPIFYCLITVSGEQAAYAVEVLPTGATSPSGVARATRSMAAEPASSRTTGSLPAGCEH
jgi:hypothetical protein